MQKCL
jgi:hypothetical protein